MKADSQALQTRTEFGLYASSPEEMGKHQQDRSKRQPIGLVPRPSDPEMPHGIHIRERYRGRPTIEVEIVVKADHLEDDAAHEVGQHHGPSHEFVGNESLHKHRQNGEQSRFDHARQQEPEHIARQLDLGISVPGLERDPTQCGGRVRGEEHPPDCQHLGQHKCPVGCGGRIDNLVHSPLSIPPDEFAGVEDRNDDREQVERAVQAVNHRARDRPVTHAPLRYRTAKGAQGIEKAQHEKHRKGRAANDKCHVKSNQGPELGQGRDAVSRARAARDPGAARQRP